MRKMYSKKQIEDIAKENGLTLDKLLALLQGSGTISVDESEDGEHVVFNLDEDYANDITRALKLPLSSPAEIKIPLIGTNNAQTNAGLGDGLEYDSETGKLNGKFVKLINASDIPSPLTDSFIEDNFINGCFINGAFAGVDNPIILGMKLDGQTYRGSLISQSATTTYIQNFAIPKSNYTPTLVANSITIAQTSNTIEITSINNLRVRAVNVLGLYGNKIGLNGKLLPDHPADTGTFTLKCVDGVLTWVQDA